MGVEAKTRSSQDSFLDALRSEIVAGTEILSSWINHVQAKGAIDCLFEFETWLRGLSSFFSGKHVPLTDMDRTALITRSFSPEIGVARLAIQECERRALELCRLGQDAKVEFEALIESQIYKTSAMESQVGKVLEQSTPLDSLERLLESIKDLKVVVDSMRDARHHDYQLYLSLGRTFQRDIHNCRYVDMLLGQRFRLQYDRIDNAVLSGILRSIPDEQVRRNVSLALLHLYRRLRYLKLVSTAISEDRPLRQYLVVFALLHEETESLCDFLKSRFLREKRGHPGLRAAAELIVHMLTSESRRALERELVHVSSETDAYVIFEKVEASHNLMANCYQGCVTGLVQAIDAKVEAKMLFPSVGEGVQNSLSLEKELWGLRQDLRAVLDKTSGLEIDRILDRITLFQESSLRHMVFQEWGEFERFSESLITATGQTEVRNLLRNLVSFLEGVMLELARRSAARHSARTTESPGVAVH
jgi:hypothetical protein